MSFRGTVLGGFRKDDVLEYIDQAAKERNELQQQVQTVQQERDALQEQVDALTATVEQLNAQLEEVDELQDALEQLREECDDLRTREAEAQQDALLAEQQFDGLQRTIDELEEQMEELKQEKQDAFDQCIKMERERAIAVELEMEARVRAARMIAEAEDHIAALYGQTNDLLVQLLDCLKAAAADSRDAARRAANRTQEAEHTVDAMMQTIDEQVRRMQEVLPHGEQKPQPTEEPAVVPAEEAVAEKPAEEPALSEPSEAAKEPEVRAEQPDEPAPAEPVAATPLRPTSELSNTLNDFIRLLRSKT